MWLTSEQLAAWYTRADILVVPSWYEPFGMVILEGMLYGLAIVAALAGGPKEILIGERTGLFYERECQEQTSTLAGCRVFFLAFSPSGLQKNCLFSACAPVVRRFLFSSNSGAYGTTLSISRVHSTRSYLVALSSGLKACSVGS